jgi:AspT/YidE/YbjL antiporter-like protein
LRSRYPVFGTIPEPAQRLLMDIGLIVFIAVIGLQAGPHAVEAYRASGAAYFASIFMAGMIVTIVPLAVGTIAGRYVLEMSPLVILGGLAGAQTCTPGLTALRRRAAATSPRWPPPCPARLATSSSRAGDPLSRPSFTRCDREEVDQTRLRRSAGEHAQPIPGVRTEESGKREAGSGKREAGSWKPKAIVMQ